LLFEISRIVLAGHIFVVEFCAINDDRKIFQNRKSLIQVVFNEISSIVLSMVEINLFWIGRDLNRSRRRTALAPISH